MINLGEVFEGGIIFHIDYNNKQCLICSEIDLGQAFWGFEGEIETSPALYQGIENTKKINEQLSHQEYIFGIKKRFKTAANLCLNFKHNGFSDWFLPSYEELLLIEKNKQFLNKTIRKTFYWSSTSAVNQNLRLHNMAYFSKMGNFDKETEKSFLGPYASQFSPFSDKCGRWLLLTVLPIRKCFF